MKYGKTPSQSIKEERPMEHSMKEGWKPVLATLMLLAICFVSPFLVAQTKPGEDVFKAKCASCHGPDGAGKTAMGTALKIRDLRSDDVQKQTDADLNRIITKGKNKMPAYDGKLKKEQIEQLVGYVRALGKKQ
jgi:mono/diheme cytochrome c family protein